MLTGEAMEAIVNSECILGAERLIKSFEKIINGKETAALTTNSLIIDAIKNTSYKTYAVLVSGDSGFFSLSKRLFPLVRAEGWECKVLCGINSTAYFASRLGVSYDDAAIISLHGRLGKDSSESEREALFNELTGVVAGSRKCFFLTGGILSPQIICRVLIGRGFGSLRVSVGERLSYLDEKISSYTINDTQDIVYGDPNILFIENNNAKKHLFTYLKDSDFERGAAPMTKEEVRSVSLAKLHVKPDAVCWDIGAGTGSVSCAMALSAPYGRVYAIEKEPDAIALIRQNKRKFGCYNLEIIEGEAPAALSPLPPPDSVFIGGTNGALRSTLAKILAHNPKSRVVINAITLETLAEARDITAGNGFSDVQITQIGVNSIQKAGKFSMLHAQNPVFVISFGGAS
jgi:precorrin-6Y C5,15-methyltransferase (decarboxylating)